MGTNTCLFVSNVKFDDDFDLSFVWFDRPGESSPEKDCCW